MSSPREPYRVLVTGSRDWDDYLAIENALHGVFYGEANRLLVVVHGYCPTGADAMAARWAAEMHDIGYAVAVEPHPAEWDKHGKAAGFMRNAEMVKAGADVCLAFIKDESRGATHCATLAHQAGIQVWTWRA